MAAGATTTSSLLGAYVLDAVDEVERRRVERLLAADPAVRAEVVRLDAAADQLAEASAAGATAPRELWKSIAARLDDRGASGSAQGDPSAGSASADPATPAAPTAPPTSAPVVAPRRSEDDESSSTVRPFARPPARRRRTTWLLTAAAAVVLLIAGAVVVGALSGRGGTDSPEVAIRKLASEARAQPGARTATLVDTEASVSVDVVVDPSGRAFVLSDSLPPVDEAHTYQLWAVDGGTPVSVGLLGKDVRAAVVGLDSEVHPPGGHHRAGGRQCRSHHRAGRRRDAGRDLSSGGRKFPAEVIRRWGRCRTSGVSKTP